jgi:hypothetical protein
MAPKMRTKGNRAVRGLACSPSAGGAMASMDRRLEPNSLNARDKLIEFIGEKGEMVIGFDRENASSYRE